MLENPEVFSKAQQEIDDVVGHNRTPELEDMKRLPYIQAIISEVHISKQFPVDNAYQVCIQAS